jgi:hydroxymethylglutaryl-CoA lyase
MKLPRFVKIVEVGPRDGLQNEPRNVATDIKLKLIKKLAAAGLKNIEATSFVSPKRVPQMADHLELMSKLPREPDVHYPVLIPNLTGLEKALSVGVTEIAIFGSASESFSLKNINCSIADSMIRFREIIASAKAHHLKIRAYLSCVMGCPYEGEIESEKVATLAEILFNLGCHEISLGDTIGVGTITKTNQLIHAVAQRIPKKKIAVHFHDTYGQALANIYAALLLGIETIDSSVGGLGGCPYARGATGNVASENVVYLMNGLGIETGISLEKLAQTGRFISDYLGRPYQSQTGIALLSRLGSH